MTTTLSTSPAARLPFDPRGLVLPAAFLIVWMVATHLQWVNTRLIVPPVRVVEAAARAASDPAFYQGVAFSLARDLGGFAVGSAGGVLLGLLLGISRLADRLIGPTFHTLRQISLFAWLPLLSSWLSYGELSKVVFIALSTLYPVALGTFDGVRQVRLDLAEVARVHRFTRIQVLRRLVLPGAAPQIATGLSLGLVHAWLATIGSEFLLANWGHGLGNLVIKGRASFDVGLILFGMVVIGAVGAVLNRIAARLEARWLHWRREAR